MRISNNLGTGGSAPIGGGGGAETNEVRTFVGAVPEGWEVITKYDTPENLATREFGLLTSGNFSSSYWNVKKNLVTNEHWAMPTSSSSTFGVSKIDFTAMTLDNANIGMVGYTNFGAQYAGGNFDFTDDGNGIVRIGTNVESKDFTSLIDITGGHAGTPLFTSKALHPVSLRMYNYSWCNNIGGDRFLYCGYNTSTLVAEMYIYDLAANTHTKWSTFDALTIGVGANEHGVGKGYNLNNGKVLWVMPYTDGGAIAGGVFRTFILDYDGNSITELTNGLDPSIGALEMNNNKSQGAIIDGSLYFSSGYTLVRYDITTEIFTVLINHGAEFEVVLAGDDGEIVIFSPDYFEANVNVYNRDGLFVIYPDYPEYTQNQIVYARKQ